VAFMKQTLFFIPHELCGLPLFGVGWLLFAWLIGGGIFLAWTARREGAAAAAGFLPFFLVVTAALAFLFPMIEAKDAEGRPIGLPLRGYGTFVLIGFVGGVWWSINRAGRRGIEPETIYSLAVWMFLAGFLGARLFFVVEYWPEFRRPTWWATAGAVAQLTEGGLVVYGALIAALPALAVFCLRKRLSPLLLGDIVAPCLALGLAFGRLGCLMNGCCYGGVCERGPIGVEFPRFNSVRQQSVSPPYQHQLAHGRLHGFALGEDADTGRPVVRSVEPDSAAKQAGLAAGMSVAAVNGRSTPTLEEARTALLAAGPEIRVETTAGESIQWTIGSLPPRSLPVHPVQVYSAINGLLLALVLSAAEPYFSRVGSTLALLLTLYPPLRILEEIIRVDEPGQFGTGLSISQWISVGTLGVAAGLWLYLWRQGSRAVPAGAEPEREFSAA
jgi:phosphatidylglycerol:prolipoprotein diacylglycerol transferase